MSDDLLESSGGIVSADSVIDELRPAQEAYSEFFGDVFDQFQAISLDLLARLRTWNPWANSKPLLCNSRPS